MRSMASARSRPRADRRGSGQPHDPAPASSKALVWPPGPAAESLFSQDS